MSEFAATVSFAGQQALFAVRGDLDQATAPKLGAILDAAIDQGHRFVVVDLAELEFMGAAGLDVIEGALRRLEHSGGRLTLRSPSATVRRILDITGLDKALRIEGAEAARQHLGPEQSTAAPGTPVAEPVGAIAHLRRVAAIPADDDVVDGALRLVVALARATVTGADGVSVSLSRHGRLATVAASDQTISDMDTDQYATGEGPCVDASVTGHWFHVESLDQESRWPAFTPRALKLGINAILSSPLMAEDRPVGSLNIYSRTRGAFAAKEQELASVFATEASIILADARVDTSDDELAGRFAEALATRTVIARAEGVTMEREGVSAEAAFTLLRTFSVRSGRPLRERAEDVVASTRWPSSDPVQQQ